MHKPSPLSHDFFFFFLTPGDRQKGDDVTYRLSGKWQLDAYTKRGKKYKHYMKKSQYVRDYWCEVVPAAEKHELHMTQTDLEDAASTRRALHITNTNTLLDIKAPLLAELKHCQLRIKQTLVLRSPRSNKHMPSSSVAPLQFLYLSLLSISSQFLSLHSVLLPLCLYVGQCERPVQCRWWHSMSMYVCMWGPPETEDMTGVSTGLR